MQSVITAETYHLELRDNKSSLPLEHNVPFKYLEGWRYIKVHHDGSGGPGRSRWPGWTRRCDNSPEPRPRSASRPCRSRPLLSGGRPQPCLDHTPGDVSRPIVNVSSIQSGTVYLPSNPPSAHPCQ